MDEPATSQAHGRPRITCTDDGPLCYERQVDGGPSGALLDASGGALACGDRVMLCRCGGSSCKPFCDGTHEKIGFSSEKTTTGVLDKVVDYEGDDVVIHDNRQLCAHVAFCTDELPEVFKYPRPEGEEWIDPHGADAAKIAEQVKRCPSGALSCTIDGEERRDYDRQPEVEVSKNGPYLLRGWVEIPDEPRNEGASLEHCALCRCGASKNKPFCDGKHWSIEFEDGQ